MRSGDAQRQIAQRPVAHRQLAHDTDEHRQCAHRQTQPDRARRQQRRHPGWPCQNCIQRTRQRDGETHRERHRQCDQRSPDHASADPWRLLGGDPRLKPRAERQHEHAEPPDRLAPFGGTEDRFVEAEAIGCNRKGHPRQYRQHRHRHRSAHQPPA
jgi:hypothetical protein